MGRQHKKRHIFERFSIYIIEMSQVTFDNAALE